MKIKEITPISARTFEVHMTEDEIRYLVAALGERSGCDDERLGFTADTGYEIYRAFSKAQVAIMDCVPYLEED